jgi:hypothetical protein
MEIDAVELLKRLLPKFSKLEVTFLFKRQNFGVLRNWEMNLRTCTECEVEWSKFIICSQRESCCCYCYCWLIVLRDNHPYILVWSGQITWYLISNKWRSSCFLDLVTF